MVLKSRTSYICAGVVALSGALVIGFQNCAPQHALNLSSVQGGANYTSPFANGKVALANGSFKASTVSSNAGSNAKSANQVNPSETVLKDGISLVVAINNSCAALQCQGGGVNTASVTESITCQHFAQESKPQLAERTQYYDLKPPQAGMTLADVEAWVDRSPIDQACVVGLSESQPYRIGGAAMFNDTYYPQQQSTLALSNFEASQSLWPGTLGLVKVAVIDTGIANDPDMGTAVIKRADYRSSADQSASGWSAGAKLES